MRVTLATKVALAGRIARFHPSDKSRGSLHHRLSFVTNATEGDGFCELIDYLNQS